MTKPGKGKVRTVTIFIRWHEEDGDASHSLCKVKPNASAHTRRSKDEMASSPMSNARIREASGLHHGNRLLPTDRLVLNALRSRISQGGQVTMPVRVREIMTECVISRRQVQICLKRLSERGLIKRLLDGVELGSHKGYRYRITQDAILG